LSKNRTRERIAPARSKSPQRRSPVSAAPKARPLPVSEQSILVTGAFGPVGILVARELLRRGYRVVAADAKASDSVLRGGNLRVLEGNLHDPVFVSSLVDGVHGVIHTMQAAATGALEDSSALLDLQTLRVLFERSKEAGVGHFVHISTGLVYKRSTRPVNERAPLEAANDHEKARIDAENLLLSKPRMLPPHVTIIRPSVIYGPRCASFMASIATLPPLVRSLGPYYPKMKGGPLTNMVHAEDVARAAVFLLNNPRAYGEIFNIADNDPRPLTDFINIAMETYGLRPLGPGIPYPATTLIRSILPSLLKDEILSPLNRMNTVLWNRLVKKHHLQKVLSPRMDKDVFEFGLRPLVLDTSKLHSTGFHLKYPRFAKGWRNTVEWYEEHRWIPRVSPRSRTLKS